MADMIVTTDKQPASSPLSPPSRIICHVCRQQFSQYTCPRCNSRYCTLQCYKSHSLRCTESFMRENVLGEMHFVKPDDEVKHKMLQVLKQFHFDEESDSVNEGFSLSDGTIERILSGGRTDVDDLLPEERRQFERAIASGQLSRMIDPWEPWWIKHSVESFSRGEVGVQLVQSLNKEDEEILSSCSTEIPSGPESPLRPLEKLSSLHPSPQLPFHLVDLLYSYCFTLRVYNGDWISDAVGSSMVLLGLSQVLGQAAQPESIQEVISGCLAQICSPIYKHMGGLNFGLALIDDVTMLISLGSSGLVCSLCDIRRLLREGRKELKTEVKSRKSEILRKLKHAENKTYFMMCWAHEEPYEFWHALAAVVKAEKGFMVKDAGRNGNLREVENKKNIKSKVLIEEVQ